MHAHLYAAGAISCLKSSSSAAARIVVNIKHNPHDSPVQGMKLFLIENLDENADFDGT